MKKALHSAFRGAGVVRDGKPATYIPKLANADPDLFGITARSESGEFCSVGDAEVEFSIQSVSKAFTFALALSELGVEEVYQRTGVEPSGDNFNSVVLDNRGLPFNPMVNAGAIAMTGLLCDVYREETFEYLHDAYNKFASTELSVDRETYRSEIATADRNRAIAHLLHGSGVIGDVDLVVETYTRQCALSVNTVSLSAMALTLANSGVNAEGEQVVDAKAARNTLSVMFSSGMYDYSGQWMVDVGVPAKSGVSGGLIACVNGQAGVASYSPPLDARGNSVRGVRAIRRMANDLDWHVFHCD